MSIPNAALQYLLGQVARMRRGGSPIAQDIVLKYDVPSHELADTLCLAYGRYLELHCKPGGDPGLDASIERISKGAAEIVMLRLRSIGAAQSFQAFWRRYARVYGPPGVRDAAFAVPSPAAVVDPGEDQPRPMWASLPDAAVVPGAGPSAARRQDAPGRGRRRRGGVGV